MRSWAFWVVAASPLLGVAAVALGGRPTWPRALGAAVAATVVVAGLVLWQCGLMIGGPRSAISPAGRPDAVDFAWMLVWSAAYGLALGAVATALLRASRRHG